MASYGNFREPVEYVINQYWRKKLLKIKDDGDEVVSHELPEYPFHIIRNAENKCEKIIYDENGAMQWSEEFIRDWRGKVVRIKVTLPSLDEEEDYYYIDLVRNAEDKVELGEVND
ncbi:hypothetical protein [Clostridium tagluense]|uniref:hypothetical protein n=1 Tax=Clostridium tagluense TaxID=360422 RepID=UPI001CF0D7F8|nr:hypothetical protein [Clostridium tagluense]MCB2300401.1 hypothetical protein [Clostridium tagluense]